MRGGSEGTLKVGAASAIDAPSTSMPSGTAVSPFGCAMLGSCERGRDLKESKDEESQRCDSDLSR